MATPLDSLGIVHETDVLILGAGASGCGAALSASRHGLRVLLADKGKLESCGSLGGGNDHFMAVLNTDAPGDTTETIVDFYCTPTSGYSPSQVRQWVEAMPQMIEVLKSLGIEFLHNADGSFYRTTGFGQPGSWWTHINNGKYIKRRLAGLIRSQGVDVLEYVQCTKILVQDGKAIGAAGFHVLDGTFHIIRAKIVISALGRLNGRVSVNSSLNPFNSAFSPFITGSQIALPYEAGAQIITLDTEQEATLLPKGWGCPGMNGITSSGAKGINALGQRYMGKYHPMMEIGPRYLLIQGTHRELTEGNGPPFVLDLTHIDRDILHHLQYDSMPGDKETWNDYCAQAGIDFSAKPMEVELSELYINGILYLKDNFETRTVKGLFGGSVFNDFSGSICSGYIAGDHAARAAGIVGVVDETTGEEYLADKISVLSMDFYDSQAVRLPDSRTVPLWVLLAASAGLLLFLLLLVIILLIRRRRRKKVDERKKQELDDMLVAAGFVPDVAAPAGADVMSLQTEKSMELRKDIRQFANDNPEIAAQMVRGWLRGGEMNG